MTRDDSLTENLLRYVDRKFAEGGAVKGYAVGGDVTDEGLEKLFGDYFGRGSDPGGLKYWKDTAAENQLTLEDIGQKFSESQEYQDQFAGPGVSSNRFAPTSDPSEWKTYYGYKPTTNDYTKMLQAALGEVGVSPSSNQYRAVYEALGNRAAANTISPDYGRGNNTIASLITPQQIHGVNPKSMTRVNSYLRSTDPATIAAVAAARASLDAYLREGQNRVLTTQTDWRGFQDGEPSPGVTLRGNPFLNRNVPDEGMISLYNTYYDAEDRPDIAARLADLQRQANAIWTPPTPEPRPTDAVLAQVQTFTDEDGRKFTESDGVRRYLDEENPLDTNQTAGRVQTANVEQNVGGQNVNNTIGDDYDYTFIPSVTPGANTDLGFSTYDPNSFKVYRNDSIDQNSIQQNLLNDSTRNWQQDFNNVVGGQFNMSNPGLVGGYNSSNIGGFDYSGLGNSLGNVGATSGFGLNTGWDFGGGWGFAEGGEVNFKKMFEGDSQAMQERARELAREAYSKGYSSLGKKKAEEWEALASKYNLPLSVGPFDNYEDQYSDAVGKWQRGLSPKQRVQTYDEGGPVKADLAVEELTNLQKILAGSNPAANVAPFQLDLGGGAQARGRVVQAGPYIDVGGGITLPLRDVMLMLDASYGKVPGTDMKPNISVKGGLRIPFSEGGPVMPSTDPMEGFSIEPEARPAIQPKSRVGTGIGGALSRMGQGISDYVTADPAPSPRELLEARMSEQARSAMDLSGLALPDRAVDVKADEFGSYPVDAEGNRLKYLRRSLLLPMVSGEDESRLAMPGFVEMAGNLMSGVAPAVKGSGAVLGSGPVRRGEKTLADLVDTYGVKKPGGNWIESSVDSKIDSLPALSASQDSVSSEALAKWADSKLKGYIKNQLGTVADPLIDVAEVKGKLHIPDERIENLARSAKPTRGDSFSTGRAQTGYNPNLIGETDLSRSWEKLSQDLITRTKYKDLIYPETIPGMPVLPPESQVNKAFFTNRDLGFDHLTDELKNAMDPNSGLPRNLQIEPEKLERFSMKQAVEHVIKINDWREKTRAEANLKIAQNAATVPVKQYDIVPGTNYPNDKGLSWVQIKSSGNKDDLEKALKYEGDAMGHCLGESSYCPQVEAGKTEIFSLRDKKGQPHVTVEVKRVKNLANPNINFLDDFPDSIVNKAMEEAHDIAVERVIDNRRDEYIDQAYTIVKSKNPKLDEDSEEFSYKIQDLTAVFAKKQAPREREFHDYINEEFRNIEKREIEKMRESGNDVVTINQIKGKSNAKPVEEYIPFVQDFIKSQNWYDVGEIKNADMIKAYKGQRLPGINQQIPPGYYTFRDLEKLGDESGMSSSAIAEWMKKLRQN